MAEKIVLETEIKTGNSATSVKSVKQELRSLQQEMANLEVGSEAFTKAAQKAGQLKDKIDDAALGVKAFNPEAKFTAFAGVLGGVANGFSVVQGAMALMGSESKDVEKLILKTQAAIAIATGINGLLGMKDAFIVLSTVIKTQVVAAFATMRAAIISTGILGLVVLIGTLVYAWMEEKKANEEATKELKRFGEENKRIQDEVTNTAIAGMKGRQKEQTELQRSFNDKIAELYKDETKTIREKNAVALELNKQLEIAQADLKDKYRKEDKEKQDELLAKKLEAEKQHDADLAQWKKEAEERKKAEDKKRDDEYLALQKKLRVDLPKQFTQQEIDNIKNSKSVKKRLDEEETAAKLAQLQMISSALGGYSQLLGEQTAAGKALAIAQTSIDTYISASAAFKNVLQSPLSKFMPDGGLSLAIFAAGGAVAAGIANVRKIVSVKVPGGGGGNQAPSAAAPSVPQFNPAVAQQVQGGGDVQLGMKPQKVYVVESDIRGTMNKVDVIQSNATIG
jgi:hypothetical protein